MSTENAIDNDEIFVDLTDSLEPFSDVPVGTYECEIRDEENMASNPEPKVSNAGNPCLSFRFTIVGSNGQEAFAGQKLFATTNLTGKAAYKTGEVLRGFAIPHTEESKTLGDGSTVKGYRFRKSEAIGRRAFVEIYERKDKKTQEIRREQKYTPITEEALG